jgi:hypothetical protein
MGRRLPVAIVAVGYSWFATGLRPFTIPIYVAVGIPVLIVLGLFWRRSRLNGQPAEPQNRPHGWGFAFWAGLTAALAAWELEAYVSSPRRDHPTLSSISDRLTSGHPSRALVFALWVCLGYGLFIRRVSSERTS